MRVVKTEIDGAFVIHPDMYRDERGFFCCTSDETAFGAVRYRECTARSETSVLRGLHIRSLPGEEKLVRCSSGSVYDVIADLRKGSPTYRQHQAFWLDGNEQMSLFIPAGCAHGYQALTDADVTYRISGEYDADADMTIAWNDPELAIDWPLYPVLSERDRNAPSLAEVEKLL